MDMWWLALELVGAFLAGGGSVVVAGALVARRKMRELRAMMQSPLVKR